MSDYTGDLDTQVHYYDRMKYITSRRHVYQTNIRPKEDIFTKFASLLTCGVLILEEWYAWNGANIVVDRPSNLRASLIHDALVTLIQQGKLDPKFKTAVDQEYYDACREDGMWLVPAITEFFGVQFHSWERTPTGKEKVAP